MLQELAQRLGGTASGDEVTGTCHGVAVTFRHVDRGDSDGSDCWTEIDAEIPLVPFVLSLRRHEVDDAREVATGGMVDLLVGDPAFDTTFLVEGAPAKAVARLLDRKAREVLMAHPYVRVSCYTGNPFRPANEPPNGLLYLRARRRVMGLEHALVLVELLARLAARVPEVIADAQLAGAPYRPGHSGVDDEVQAVRAVQVDRGKRMAREILSAGWGVTVLFIAGFVSLVVLISLFT